MSRVKSFVKVRNRLIWLFVIALSMVLLLIFYLNRQEELKVKNSQDIGSVINRSGRQRMISQWLTKEVLIVADDVLEREKRLEMDSVLLVFQESNSHLKIKAAMLGNENLNGLFRDLQPNYESIVSILSAFIAGDTLMDYREHLIMAESAFLPIMDEITYQFELEQTQIFQKINGQIQTTYYILVGLLFIAAVVVLLFTLTIIRSYAEQLNIIGEELQVTLGREKSKLAKLNFLTDTIKVGVWEKDLIEGVERWSVRLYELLGFTSNDFEGTAKEFMSLVHPSDLPLLNAASDKAIQTGEPETVEIRVRNSKGEYIWVEASGNARRDESGSLELLIGGVLDITDRKLLEVQLKSFIERAPAAIAMFDTDMKYLAASQKWKDDYFIHNQEIIGKSHYAIFPEIGDEWKTIHRKCLQGDIAFREEDPFDRADGSIQYIRWEVRPWYRTSDQIGGILMFTQDVTENKREKEELRKAKQEAESAARSKEEFLATMSHEIRTPLNAIIGISHILKMEDHKPEQVEQIRLLRFSGENLLSLINDILDITKINSGKIELNLGRFDLRYLTNNIKNSLAFKATENMVNLTVSYDDDLPNNFEGDVTRIAQIMNNLVGNAIKFTRNGEVCIRVEKLALSNDRAKIRISVEDEGIGIDPINQAKIFDSFEQAEIGTTRRYGGSGLGLYITKKLVELMGSRIELQSAPEKGSTFFFDLELPVVSMDITVNQEESKASGIEEYNLNILIAEDNTANQLIVMKYLNAVHISFDVVSNGLEAIDFIKSQEYDMVFMDLQMPEMDGYEATHTIRNMSDEYFKKVPIVALTADAFVDIMRQTETIGMTDYLSKPFKPVNLYQVIKRNLGKVTPRKKELKLNQVITQELGDELNFKKNFIQECYNSYAEFYQTINLLLVQPDLEELKRVTHKMKSLNLLLHLDRLQSALDELIRHEESYIGKKGVINYVLNQIKDVIDELSRLKNSQ